MTRGRYSSLQPYSSSEERGEGGKIEKEIILMHMTQGNQAFMNRDYLVLCHCGVLAGEETCFHSELQRAGEDETATGMLLVFCRHRYRSYTAPFGKMNHQKK